MAALLALGVSGSAYAGPVTITFDTMGACTGLSGTNGPAQIQTYMNCVLGAGSVTSVTAGAVVSKGAGANATGTTVAAGYTGDGHAVSKSTNQSQSLTLGNTEGAIINGTSNNSPSAGAADAFIMNNALANSSYTSFAFQFGNGFTIAAGSQITFDYQIFPDGSCPVLNTNCGTSNSNRPDFKFMINGAQVGSTMLGDTPSQTNYMKSPVSGGSNELTPQELGVFTYTVASNLVNPLLTFVDWPATIGIDNLTLTTPNPPVPEPVTLTLFGLGMVGLRTYRRRMVA